MQNEDTPGAVSIARPNGQYRDISRGVRATQKVSSQVAHLLLGEIVSGDLRQGDPLDTEADMLARYGVSRASLREALRLLEVQGVLTLKPGPGGGPRVSRPTALDFGNMVSMHLQLAGTTFGELIDARLLLEPQCALLAARRHNELDTAALDAAVSVEERQEENDAAWQRESMRFHDAVMAMSGNRAIELFARSLKEIFTDRVVGGRFHAEQHEKVAQDHERIARAIKDGESGLAHHLMHEHAYESMAVFKRVYPGLLDEVVTWR